jgi:pimeloyl-ACP methyl ester carboxylesterase
LHTHTRTFGQGPRKALAIHCTLAHSGTLAGLAGELSDLLTTIAYDLPSHGGSGDWDGTGNLHDIATDMARGLLSEPMDLIGHSFGATVALRLAIENPELVRSVTMIEPVYFAAALEDEPQLVSEALSINQEFDDAWVAGDTYGAARAFNGAWGDGTKWEDFSDRARTYMAERIHFVAGSSAFLHKDSAGLLQGNKFARATMPALLIEGGASPQIVDVLNASIARRLPNSIRSRIDGAGHMAPITHPKETAVPIRAFLDRT